jgi:catechol 2,3-dioxygenase-like lactoylglutathione lyase family enzyme
MRFFMVEVRVVDWPRALGWYRRTLGLAVRLEDVPRQFALLDAGPVVLALKGGATPGEPREAARLVFEVEDVDAECARILGLGVAVGEPIEGREEGYREVRFADLDGTPIHLFSWVGPRERPGLYPAG